MERIINKINKKIDSIERYFVDYKIASKHYALEKSIYLHKLKNNEDIPEELEFIFTLPKIECLEFIDIIETALGVFYYPGMNALNDSSNDIKYYILKKQFLAKKNNEEFVAPKIKNSYVGVSVFSSNCQQNTTCKTEDSYKRTRSN